MCKDDTITPTKILSNSPSRMAYQMLTYLRSGGHSRSFSTGIRDLRTSDTTPSRASTRLLRSRHGSAHHGHPVSLLRLRLLSEIATNRKCSCKVHVNVRTIGRPFLIVKTFRKYIYQLERSCARHFQYFIFDTSFLHSRGSTPLCNKLYHYHAACGQSHYSSRPTRIIANHQHLNTS